MTAAEHAGGAAALRGDLDRIFGGLEADWTRLKGARLFITGGTGFIGRWLLESLYDADARLDLGIRAVILSRDPEAFITKVPHLSHHRGFTFVSGDVATFHAPAERFSHVIHAATDASAELNERDPRRMFDTIVAGTRRALDLASTSQARFFLLSSGAVYGQQPWELAHVAEDWRGGPDPGDPRAAYAEGKRAAEMLCAIYAKQFDVDVVIARIFALLGPLLSLDIHFAAGNFIGDAIAGRTIKVISSGAAVRSYLYAADMTTWLWKILLRAERGAVYNVGSEHAISVAELAAKVAGLLGGDFAILGREDPGWHPGRYVPSTAKIRGELGVCAETSLDDAIRRTAIWNGWTR